MKFSSTRLLISVTFLLLPIASFAKKGNIKLYKNIRYEYFNKDSLNERDNPLIICIPGFTQYSQSPEFIILKSYFKNKGVSYLIMNPPQHGEDYTWFKKLYSWGETEVNDLIKLIESLKLQNRHDEFHLLGFSIGAKVVLKFAAISAAKSSLWCTDLSKIISSTKSVIAVATPYRVGDINMRLSGDFRKIPEGLISGFYAMDRAGLFRIVYMILFGMNKALIVNKSSPANEIPLIRSPTLLLHGADDWLTNSYHSVKLYDYAKDFSQFSLVILQTRTHAEDMLSRDGSKLRISFFETLNEWFEFINQQKIPENKALFNNRFNRKLRTNTKIANLLYDANRVSLMSSPTFNEHNTNTWISPADFNHSLISFNTAFNFNGNSYTRYFLTFGLTKTHGFIWERSRIGLSFEQNDYNEISSLEGYVSLYKPLGSILWLRRFTFIQGFYNSFNRQIFSADLAFLLLDFQINYGKFINHRNDWQLGFNFPLVSNASGSYYFGIGYSRFLSSAPNPLFKNNFKAYLVVGPQIQIFKTRFRVNVKYEQNGIDPTVRKRIWSAGVMFNFHEKQVVKIPNVN